MAAWQRLPGLPDRLATINLEEQSFYYVMQLYNYGPFDRMWVSVRLCAPVVYLEALHNALCVRSPLYQQAQSCRLSQMLIYVASRCRFPRDPATNRKLFFYPSVVNIDPAIISCVSQTLCCISAPQPASASSCSPSLRAPIIWQTNHCPVYPGNISQTNLATSAPRSTLASCACRYIESNGGANNIVVVPMWAGQQSIGSWSFMSYCQAPVFFGTAACNQVRRRGAKDTSTRAYPFSNPRSGSRLPFRCDRAPVVPATVSRTGLTLTGRLDREHSRCVEQSNGMG